MTYLKEYSPYFTDEPKCPKCGCPCSTAYFNAEHQIIGCDECIYGLDARYIHEFNKNSKKPYIG